MGLRPINPRLDAINQVFRIGTVRIQVRYYLSAIVRHQMARKLSKTKAPGNDDEVDEKQFCAGVGGSKLVSSGAYSQASRGFNKWFASFAANISKSAGSPLVFCIALASILGWAASGPYLGYSPGWQMVVNTGTTICTFLMVFIIQNSQNRDGLALQIKLDEIIRAVHGAKNGMINLETLSHEELEQMQTKFAEIGSSARQK
jgi:low affinity Fe/Cu permease